MTNPLIKCDDFFSGLVITKVYYFVSYVAARCFKTFGDTVTEHRREADRNPEQAIKGNMFKLQVRKPYKPDMIQVVPF